DIELKACVREGHGAVLPALVQQLQPEQVLMAASDEPMVLVQLHPEFDRRRVGYLDLIPRQEDVGVGSLLPQASIVRVVVEGPPPGQAVVPGDSGEVLAWLDGMGLGHRSPSRWAAASNRPPVHVQAGEADTGASGSLDV